MRRRQLLEVENLSAGYLGKDVIHNVALTLAEGEAVAIIGSNGAGKTTLFRAICGLVEARTGRVMFDGSSLIGLLAYQVARNGLAYVPAERRLFPTMSVRENLILGCYPHRLDAARLEFVYSLFPQLAARRSQRAGTMSGGEQQMLAVGRALMSKPRLLLLDEPTTGLSPKLAQTAYTALRALKSEGLTLLIAEQQVPLALSIADRGYVLEDGRVQLEGSSQELGNNSAVRSAYLGVA